jgi:ketosteroid isomerase-like protein
MEDATIIQPDGQMIRGRNAIAGALQALVDNEVSLEILVANVFAAGPVAAAVGTLKISGTDRAGAPYEQRSQSVVIYSRGPDGWRLAIDAPWGLPA